MTDGTEPLAPAKLLNSVEISERLRYELEQWFLLKKKHLQIQTSDSLTELNTKFSQAGIERRLSHDLEVLRAVSFAFLLLEETISLVRLENSA